MKVYHTASIYLLGATTNSTSSSLNRTTQDTLETTDIYWNNVKEVLNNLKLGLSPYLLKHCHPYVQADGIIKYNDESMSALNYNWSTQPRAVDDIKTFIRDRK